MKKQLSIKRDPKKVPKPGKISPAADLIQSELEERGITAAAAARSMKIPRQRLSDIFAGRKGVSADTALRIQAFLGIDAEYFIRLQAKHDFSTAYHAKNSEIVAEVVPA